MDENCKIDKVSVRLVPDAPVYSDRPINNSKDAVDVIGKHIAELDREVVCVVNLKSNGIPINFSIVSMGAVNYTLAHPREILKTAFLSNASSIILIHNHPSGDLKPSKYDCDITKKMVHIGEMVGIPVVDHVIVTSKGYFSFRDNTDLIKESLGDKLGKVFESEEYYTESKMIAFPKNRYR